MAINIKEIQLPEATRVTIKNRIREKKADT